MMPMNPAQFSTYIPPSETKKEKLKVKLTDKERYTL